VAQPRTNPTRETVRGSGLQCTVHGRRFLVDNFWFLFFAIRCSWFRVSDFCFRDSGFGVGDSGYQVEGADKLGAFDHFPEHHLRLIQLLRSHEKNSVNEYLINENLMS